MHPILPLTVRAWEVAKEGFEQTRRRMLAIRTSRYVGMAHSSSDLVHKVFGGHSARSAVLQSYSRLKSGREPSHTLLRRVLPPSSAGLAAVRVGKVFMRSTEPSSTRFRLGLGHFPRAEQLVAIAFDGVQRRRRRLIACIWERTILQLDFTLILCCADAP